MYCHNASSVDQGSVVGELPRKECCNGWIQAQKKQSGKVKRVVIPLCEGAAGTELCPGIDKEPDGSLSMNVSK